MQQKKSYIESVTAAKLARHLEVMKLTAWLALTALALPALAPSQTKPIQPDTSEAAPGSAIMRTAIIIQVVPQIKKLAALDAAPTDPYLIMLLREQILGKVVAASLQVDATVAQIDNEIAQANELRSFLADKRDRAVNRANLWSIIAGGGLGAASAGLQLPSSQHTSSAIVGIAGGALSSGLAISGIRAQRGATRVFDFNSNMLAQFFGRSPLEDSSYDPIVWSFLNEVAPTDPENLTRKDRLIHTWYTLKRIDPPTTVSGKRKVDRVTSRPSAQLQLTIDDLEDRAAMLEDVRAKISFLKRDLAALLLSVPDR